MIERSVVDTEFSPSPVKKTGDLAILYGMLSGKSIRDFFFEPKKAFWNWVRQFLAFNFTVMASVLTNVFRFKPGIQQSGFILTITMTSMLLTINSQSVWPVFIPLGNVLVPVLCFFWDWPELVSRLWDSPRSEILRAYTVLLAVASSIHAVAAYCGFGNDKISKRGVSYIYTALLLMFPDRRWAKKSEFFICAFVEPGLMFSIGAICWQRFQDPWFAAVCFAAACAEMLCQLSEKAYRLKVEALLRA